MWRLISRPEVRWPLMALAGASALGWILLVSRFLLSGRPAHVYLLWNLFLAWVPMLLALRWEELERTGAGQGWKFWGLFAAWLLFFPNAPYLFTDLAHLKQATLSRWWTDLILILFFAVIGIVLAFLSLHRVQVVVARRHGWIPGWICVAAVAWLSGFGVYLGRFHRWNTWDVLANPLGLLADSLNWMHRHSFKFTSLFGLFLFVTYALLYSLTRLGPPNLVVESKKS